MIHLFVTVFLNLSEEEIAMELFFPIANASAMNVAPVALWNLNWKSSLMRLCNTAWRLTKKPMYWHR
jgi:hypothetical protein